MIGEIWKDIPWYEELYKVSDHWRIKSTYLRRWSEIVLRQGIGKHGYNKITLCKDKIHKSMSVHRIVADTFIQNPLWKPCVNHKNGIKTDNRIGNLEWCTYRENMVHSWRVGLSKVTENNGFIRNPPKKGKFWEAHPRSTRVDQFSLDWVLIKHWGSLSDVERETWIPNTNISLCCRMRRKTAGWFIWKINK